MTDQPDNTAATPRAQRKTREGLVVSHKMDKSVIAEVEERVKPDL